ncbi:DUF1987 domain-containing protein [Williamwhitmania taraxaci]|uniref:SiaC family regulatory phosphoprotein domain-containing protein n=1 Tax=Williamwhitmania taraxaci TaxID=1640674 RepID=A0A1G6LY49_9BACT|nr:DUF1987 domain-containing protein [Williamwhitmania taraxaci]SDC47974.1 protein of unknown function [Williamwhitmania taraxaci]
MKPLIIEPTEFTPDVNFNPSKHTLDIAGFSRPENVIGYYKPVVTWIQDYIDETFTNNKEFDKPVIITNFRMTYFNSSSAKFLLDILFELRKVHDMGNKIVVNWYYESDDDEIKESGEELSDLVCIPFNYFAY